MQYFFDILNDVLIFSQVLSSRCANILLSTKVKHDVWLVFGQSCRFIKEYPINRYVWYDFGPFGLQKKQSGTSYRTHRTQITLYIYINKILKNQTPWTLHGWFTHAFLPSGLTFDVLHKTGNPKYEAIWNMLANSCHYLNA